MNAFEGMLGGNADADVIFLMLIMMQLTLNTAYVDTDIYKKYVLVL